MQQLREEIDLQLQLNVQAWWHFGLLIKRTPEKKLECVAQICFHIFALSRTPLQFFLMDDFMMLIIVSYSP